MQSGEDQKTCCGNCEQGAAGTHKDVLRCCGNCQQSAAVKAKTVLGCCRAGEGT